LTTLKKKETMATHGVCRKRKGRGTRVPKGPRLEKERREMTPGILRMKQYTVSLINRSK